MHCVHAQGFVVAVQERTQVQRGTGSRGSPILLALNESGQRFQRILLRDLRQAKTLGRVVQPADILHRAEQLHGAVGTAICLQSLENLGAVMEHRGCGMEGDGCKRNDSGIVPALLRIVVHHKHMIGKNLTEAKGTAVRFLLRAGGFGDRNIH